MTYPRQISSPKSHILAPCMHCTEAGPRSVPRACPEAVSEDRPEECMPVKARICDGWRYACRGLDTDRYSRFTVSCPYIIILPHPIKVRFMLLDCVPCSRSRLVLKCFQDSKLLFFLFVLKHAPVTNRVPDATAIPTTQTTPETPTAQGYKSSSIPWTCDFAHIYHNYVIYTTGTIHWDDKVPSIGMTMSPPPRRCHHHHHHHEVPSIDDEVPSIGMVPSNGTTGLCLLVISS